MTSTSSTGFPLIGSLCSGYGGLDLEVQARPINPDASRILARQWPGVPNLGDITVTDWACVPRSAGVRSPNGNGAASQRFKINALSPFDVYLGHTPDWGCSLSIFGRSWQVSWAGSLAKRRWRST
jgi:hypothetical protein